MNVLEPHSLSLSLCGVLLVGLLTDAIGWRTRLPRATLLILFGVAWNPQHKQRHVGSRSENGNFVPQS